MKRVLKISCGVMMATALALTAGSEKAEAGGFGLYISNYGQTCAPRYRYSTGSFYRHHVARPTYNYSRLHRSYGHPRVPHYDYHPPSLVPHGNHYDLVPGHWDYHGRYRLRHH